MRRIVLFLLLAVVAQLCWSVQAAVENLRWQLKPVDVHVQEDTKRRTPQEWQDILARQRSRPEISPGFVKGSAPQPPEAGRTSKDFQGRVINGGTAARGQFPWHAHIVLGSSSFCGGSLISSTWTVTAANCVSGYASYTVTLGVTNLAVPQEGTVSQVSRYWVMHSDYAGIFTQKDIAIIKLPSPVSFNDFISPVRLPRYSQVSESFAGLDATVSGFGRLSSYNFTYSPSLQFAQVKIITNDECERYYPLNFYETSICSLGEDGRSPCNGDNGGAMVIAEDDGLYTVVGISSFHLINCPSGAPTVFSRITSYLKWIETYSGIAVQE